MTTTTREHDRPTEYAVPADVPLLATEHTLDGFAAYLHEAHGVDVRELAPGTVVSVRTRHSCYRLVVIEPEMRLVLISGGDRFSTPTEAHLVGATGGGSMLKLGWIAVGLRVELRRGYQRTTTSSVEAISIERPTT